MKRVTDPTEALRELQLAVIRYCYSPTPAKRRAITTWLKRHQRLHRRSSPARFKLDVRKSFWDPITNPPPPIPQPPVYFSGAAFGHVFDPVAIAAAELGGDR